MEFKQKLRFLKKDSNENIEIKSITNKLPDNMTITTDVLRLVENDTTKIKLDKDIKNSYYVYLQDTIYLADNEKNKVQYGRISLIAHECIHSIQSKLLQKLNFIFANIELLAFIVIFIIGLFNVNIIYAAIGYAIITLISATFRLMLEIDAVKRSIPLAVKYMSNNLKSEETKLVESIYKFQIRLTYPLFILSLLFGKIFRLVLLFLLLLLK